MITRYSNGLFCAACQCSLRRLRDSGGAFVSPGLLGSWSHHHHHYPRPPPAFSLLRSPPATVLTTAVPAGRHPSPIATFFPRLQKPRLLPRRFA